MIGSVITPDDEMPLSELYLRSMIEGWQQTRRVKETTGLADRGMSDDAIDFILDLTQAFGLSTWDTWAANLVQHVTGELEQLLLALYWQRGNHIDDS
ncbi:MAG: hypothetical protein M1820_008142 [Bogoriella megaspora]|nr:MAG: hypothetical protein M1820_008142 [Bogoriella megaspora]